MKHFSKIVCNDYHPDTSPRWPSWSSGLALLLVIGVLGQSAMAQLPVMPRTAEQIVSGLSLPSDKQNNKALRLRGKRMVLRGPSRIVDDAASKINLAGDYPALVEGRPKVAALVQFDFDSARLRREAYPLLNEYAKALRGELSNAVLLIAGHTDAVGSATYNARLSVRRARAVKNYLLDQGIHSRQLVVQGYGEGYPIATNESSGGRALNRRSEFIRVGSL